jgi:DnaJ family protein B protein 12
VSRTADESEIKRAYKKLALRFHPDKNAAPSAEAAFKAINAAVETLSDASKRRMYDQLGHEGATSAAASGGGAGGGGPFGGGGFHGGNMHEFTPEDMFNMFFNGGAFGNTGGGFRTYSFGPGMRRRAAAAGGRRGGGTAEEDQQAQGGLNTLFNLLPVFLLLLSMSGLFSGSGDAAWQRPYSIHQTPPYSVPRYTASYGVTKDIPYFVTTNFQPSKSDLRRVEAQVEVEFKNDLHMKCDRQKRQKNKQLSEVS